MLQSSSSLQSRFGWAELHVNVQSYWNALANQRLYQITWCNALGEVDAGRLAGLVTWLKAHGAVVVGCIMASVSTEWSISCKMLLKTLLLPYIASNVGEGLSLKILDYTQLQRWRSNARLTILTMTLLRDQVMYHGKISAPFGVCYKQWEAVVIGKIEWPFWLCTCLEIRNNCVY